MQAKLGAAFLVVALLWLVVGLAVPRLGLNPLSTGVVSVSSHVVLALGAAWVISRWITRRLRHLAQAAEVISRGDLTRSIDRAHGADEIAGLSRAFATMTESLYRIVCEVRAVAARIRESSRALSVNSAEMHAKSEAIASGTRSAVLGAEDQVTQVGRITETTGSVLELAEHVANCAQVVHRSATDAGARAAGSADDARRASAGIAALADRTVAATDAVEGFRLRASEIGELIDSITSISHQTHLLAINAAIEAARAGEEGRGFAVVAEEVSRLADSVRQFAEQISAISEEIMNGSRIVAEQIRDSVRAAEEVRSLVERNTTTFEGLLSAIESTAGRAGEISRLTERQRGVSEGLSDCLGRISKIARRNATGAEETSTATREQTLAAHQVARSTEDLSESAERLHELVAVFEVDRGPWAPASEASGGESTD